MGKGHRHQKHLKSEKSKVKLKAKSSKLLPKGLNITDCSFKVKKIVLQEQLKQNAAEIVSRRKLNVKDLLTRLQHYNSSVRQEAIKELKEIMMQHAREVLNMQLNSLLQGISALILDKERAIRRESLKVLTLILGTLTKEQIVPFCNMLISYLTCGMTHIDQNIMEDSLLFLDILIQSNKVFEASNSYKILVYFLDMISKFQTQSNTGRQLTTNLNSKNTSIKWRLKVLNSLEYFLLAIVKNKLAEKNNLVKTSSKSFNVADEKNNYAIYSPNLLQVCSINCESSNLFMKNNESLNLEVWKKYIDSLMPLMFDSWMEVCPRAQTNSLNAQSLITNEAALLLKCITCIVQSIVEYIELLENECESISTSEWFKNKFEAMFIKSFLQEFPYIEQNTDKKLKKRQDDFAETPVEICLEQNLALCHVFVWFTSVTNSGFDIEVANQITDFVTEKLEKWSSSNNSGLPQLIKLLRVLFLKASKIWYGNKISMGNILGSAIKAYLRQPRKELQVELFVVLEEIAMNHNLDDLHCEESFRDFVKSLPQLLLKTSIYDSTIRLLNRVTLQYKDWIKKELEENSEAIIENAKSIEIISSEDVGNSRLMICNLFYFMNGQIYY